MAYRVLAVGATVRVESPALDADATATIHTESQMSARVRGTVVTREFVLGDNDVLPEAPSSSFRPDHT